MKQENKKIAVLFDGVCILCNTAVYTLNKHLDGNIYDFIPSQSPEGEKIISEYNLGKISNDSVVVITDNKVLLKSRAVMFLLKDMPVYYKVFRILNFLPAVFLDFFYDLVAKYRHLIFKRKNEGISCNHEIK